MLPTSLDGPEIRFNSTFFKLLPAEENETSQSKYGTFAQYDKTLAQYGKALAQWLAQQLKSRGIANKIAGGLAEIVIPQDWGAIVCVSCLRYTLFINCGRSENMVWGIGIEAVPSLLQRVFEKDPGPAFDQLRHHLDEIVTSIPGVADVRWHERQKR